jgi:hypothetical protein
MYLSLIAFAALCRLCGKEGARQGKKIKAMTYLAHHGSQVPKLVFLYLLIQGSDVLENGYLVKHPENI